MKEITRVHIARISYDCEISAKKSLEMYFESVTTHANIELEQDVEIRVTELLLERGVKKGEVITMVDVAAIRQQLGEPSVFAIEENKIDSVAHEEPIIIKPQRRLYRDPAVGIFGGVMSGLAAYFKTNVLLIRLLAVFIFFITGAVGIVPYIVLWIALPVARTSAQLLELSGQPTTLDAIRQFNDAPSRRASQIHTSRIIHLIMLTGLGIAALVSALFTAFITTYSAYNLSQSGIIHEANGFLIVPLMLMFMAGLLLAGLLLCISFACFSRSISRRLLLGSAIITALGIGMVTMTGIFIGYDSYPSGNGYMNQDRQQMLDQRLFQST